VTYRYIPEDSCAIAEQCVGGSGWRRLLQFDATIHNKGREPVLLGDVEADDSVIRNANMVSFSPCHSHYHFAGYGQFLYNRLDGLGAKRAFCVESTERHSNNEFSPISHNFTCANQGVAAGWGDSYLAGIECQWVDITGQPSPATVPLSFEINPWGLLCEGTINRNPDGSILLENTDFLNPENNLPVQKISCSKPSNWSSNNFQELPVTTRREGGVVEEPCARNELSPTKDCGFEKIADRIPCAAGKKVSVGCDTVSSNGPAVVRFCETSQVLGHGVSCGIHDALANVVVGGNGNANGASFEFECPSARDSEEIGGQYSVYIAPLIPGDRVHVVCAAKSGNYIAVIIGGAGLLLVGGTFFMVKRKKMVADKNNEARETTAVAAAEETQAAAVEMVNQDVAVVETAPN
jgi:hypothetical protein